MPPALAAARSWNARSPALQSPLPSTPPTPIAEHTARLHEPSKSESPTQLAYPLRSRYVWGKGVTSASPRGCSSPGAADGGKPTARGFGGRNEPSRERQRRYSSFEAHVVDGEVLDGETGWTSPSRVHHHPHSRRGSAAGTSALGRNSSNSPCAGGVANKVSSNGTGSGLRPGGRSNFFFGADYSTLAGTCHGNSRADSVAAKLPVGRVDRKAAALLGVAGSAGEVPSKAQKVLGVGRREGEEGLSALLDESSDLNSGADSNSPREAEAPPAFAPLGGDDSSTVTNSCAGEDDAKRDAMNRCSSSSNQRDGMVQVDFPPDFDASRKGSDSDDSGKTRGGGSLGTKSGSTSLLSMLSGSPRSLATPRDSAAGSPSPRTPLSDRSSSDAAAAAIRAQDSGRESDAGGASAATAATVSAAVRGRSSASHEPWTGGSRGVDPDRRRQSDTKAGQQRQQQERLPNIPVDDYDEADLPSAHPTPLSAFGADTDLPSDHPTPLSTHGSRHGRRAGGAVTAAGGGNSSKGDAGGSRSKPLKAQSSSFMQRLKYWGGGGSGDGSSSSANRRSPASSAGTATPSRVRDSKAIAAKTTNNNAASTAVSVAVERAGPPVDRDSGRGGTAGRETPTVIRADGEGRSIDAASPLTGAEMSPAELRGVKVMPYDSVTSDSASAYRSTHSRRSTTTSAATRPSSATHREGIPVEGSSSVEASSSVGESSVGKKPSSTSSSRYPPSRHHRKVDSQEVPGFAPLASSSSSRKSKSPQMGSAAASSSSSAGASKPAAAVAVSARGATAAKIKTAPVDQVTASSSAVRTKAPPAAVVAVVDQDMASSSAVRKFNSFGAAHRKELAELRRARGSITTEDEEEDEEAEEEEEEEEEVKVEEEADETESEMDWDAASDDEGREVEEEETKEEIDDGRRTMADKVARYVTPRGRGLGAGPSLAIAPPAVPPPRYMALVDEATGTSPLDSSTSEQETSPSEDDGGMMAEILTDRLMEVCSKMEAAAAPPADELSDGEGGKLRSARRRVSSNASSIRTFGKDQGGAPSSRRHGGHSAVFSSSGIMDREEQDVDSDEGSVRDDGAMARKMRRERLRKRSRAQSRRNLAAALTVPTDEKGEPINFHTAAYSGRMDLLASYISQGGDLEARDQFQATALMLSAERGHTELVEALLAAGVDTCCVDENGNSALHLACFYSNEEVVRLLLSVDVDVEAEDAEGRTPLQLVTDPAIRRMVQTEEMVRMSGENFDLLGAVEVNDISALSSFITMGQEACGYPGNMNAIAIAAQRLRLDRVGRGGMTAVHLAAFHGYADMLGLLLESGCDTNAVCDDGETPLHTACTGGSTLCATLLLDHGANPLATDANGLVPCEKHIAGGRQEMKRLLEAKAFQATPSNLMALRHDLAEVALQIDAEEDLFVRKGVAIKYLRKALKKKEADTARLRLAVDARDVDIRNLRDRMESVHRLLTGVAVH